MVEYHIGSYWAAIKGGSVISLIPMKVPLTGEDFNNYRAKAIECLGILGDVKAGVVIERNGDRYFVQRLTHANREIVKRTPTEYLLYHPKNMRTNS